MAGLQGCSHFLVSGRDNIDSLDISFNHNEQVNIGDDKQLTSTSWAVATSTILGVFLVKKLKLQRRRWCGICEEACTG